MRSFDQAACRHHDPELFFPVSAVGPGREQTESAKRVCRTCPVLAECLDWALATAIPFGVVGGLSEAERLAIRRRADAGHHAPALTSPTVSCTGARYESGPSA
jgi:WhiB family transcriptional regulator, redox-sensing transcriptional regulator